MPKRVLRLFSFLVKEILDVLQQPRLVVTLIAGPFLILLIFGLGFVGKQGPVETIVVMSPDAQVPLGMEVQAVRYADFLPIQDILESREEALERLQAGEVEMVVVVPADAQSTFLAGEQILVEVLVNAYDPVRTQWLNYISGFIATDVNNQLLTEAVGQAREATSRLRGISTALLDRVAQVGDAVEAEDLDVAQERLDELLATLEEEEDRIEPLLSGLLGVGSTGDTRYASGDRPELLATALGLLQRVRDEVARLRQLLDDPALDPSTILAQVKSLRDRVVELQAMADMLDAIPDEVLVAPVTTEITNVSPAEPDYMSFYAPAVLALLLQHIAVTFGSLTMVRERLLGAEELFRVAPIAPWEIVTGKYLSYSLLTVAIGLVLSILIVAVMRVPLLGSVFYFFLVLVLVAAAGLGWGLLVSVLSRRESQAVQFSMLILLASVFFGGFFLPLSGLLPAVHFVSYSLPVTYGVQALREIMLAGRAPGAELLLPLAGMSVGLFAACVLIYTWQHKRE